MSPLLKLIPAESVKEQHHHGFAVENRFVEQGFGRSPRQERRHEVRYTASVEGGRHRFGFVHPVKSYHDSDLHVGSGG